MPSTWNILGGICVPLALLKLLIFLWNVDDKEQENLFVCCSPIIMYANTNNGTNIQFDCFVEGICHERQGDTNEYNKHSLLSRIWMLLTVKFIEVRWWSVVRDGNMIMKLHKMYLHCDKDFWNPVRYFNVEHLNFKLIKHFF